MKEFLIIFAVSLSIICIRNTIKYANTQTGLAMLCGWAAIVFLACAIITFNL